MGDSRTDLGQKGFRSQDHTAGGKLGNPIGQPVVVQMGKLKPRVGKGFAQSHTESYAASTVVLLSDSWSRPTSGTFYWPGRSLGWVFRSPTGSRGRRCKNMQGFVLSGVVLIREGDSPLCHHKMVRCSTQARWSVYIRQLNRIMLPKGLSKQGFHNFNLLCKAPECKERKGTRGLMCSICEFSLKNILLYRALYIFVCV